MLVVGHSQNSENLLLEDKNSESRPSGINTDAIWPIYLSLSLSKKTVKTNGIHWMALTETSQVLTPPIYELGLIPYKISPSISLVCCSCSWIFFHIPLLQSLTKTDRGLPNLKPSLQFPKEPRFPNSLTVLSSVQKWGEWFSQLLVIILSHGIKQNFLFPCISQILSSKQYLLPVTKPLLSI